MVLAALGVVKVATARQIRLLMAPGHANNQTFLNGAKDLATHGLVVTLGSAKSVNASGNRIAEKLWNLTPDGLAAAGVVLGREVREMGSTAKASVASGAPHARKVTDTITAFLQPIPQPTKPVARKNRSTPAPAAALPLPPPGIGSIEDWETEVVLPVAGSVINPVKGSVRADAVLVAPQAGLPLLCVEVDNGTEDRPRLAAKLTKYVNFYRRTVKAGQREVPFWTTLYEVGGREGYPPLAIVFTADVGPTAMMNRMKAVRDLSRPCWQGAWCGEGLYGRGSKDGYRDYTRSLPVIVTTLARLQQYGPTGPIWWRYGHSDWEVLEAALDNPDDSRAYYARDEERRRAADAEREEESRVYEEQRVRLEAAAWPCPTCGRTVYPTDAGPADGWDRKTECSVCRSIAERERREAEETAALAEESDRTAKRDGLLGFLHEWKNG